MRPICSYTLINKDRKVTTSFKIRISTPRLLHDFAITENYIVIPDMPVELNPIRVARDRDFIASFNHKGKCRYGFVKKYSHNDKDIKWFDLPPHYAFHFGNAWEERNEKGDEIIKIYNCPSKTVDVEFKVEHPFFNHKN